MGETPPSMSRLGQLVHIDGGNPTLYLQAGTTHDPRKMWIQNLKKKYIYFKYYLMETNCVSVCMAKHGVEIFITFAQ